MINKNKRSGTSWWWVLLLVGMVFLPPVMSYAGGPGVGRTSDISMKRPRPVVVIDPGHGGRDTGVTGPEGGMEKEAAFALAEALVRQLAPDCQVVLTRTGDYTLEIRERSSIANHCKADLFISLHAGASSRRALNRWTLYHDASVRPTAGYPKPSAPPFAWHRLQQPHLKASERFAGCLQQRLAAALVNQEVDIAPAPIAVLQGADMPAVLIETGYLTHPAAARAMAQDAHIRKAARAIADGISDYFRKN